MSALPSTTTTSTTTTSPATSPAQPLDYATVYAATYPTTLARAQRLFSSATTTDGGATEGWLAEDIAQEVWTRMLASWPKLSMLSETQVRGCAWRTTERLVIDRLRRRALAGRHGRVVLTDDLWEIVTRMQPDTDEAGQPERVLLARELAATLSTTVTRDASARLAASRRPMPAGTTRAAAALFQAMVADEPNAVTARRLGLTEPAVKQAHWRMRQTLRQSVNEWDKWDKWTEQVAG